MTKFRHWGSWKPLAFLLMLLLGALSACQRPEPEYSIATLEEVRAFAADLQVALNTEDRSFFVERCDHRRFTDYCFQEMLNSRELDDATQEIKLGFTFGDYFLGDGETYEYVEMLPVRNLSPNYYVFFRRTDTDCSYQYLEARIERRKDETDSRTVMTDILPYNMGEWFSEILGENIAAVSKSYPKSPEIDDALSDALSEVQDLYTEGEVEAAEKAFAVLPPEVRNTRITWQTRLYALMAEDSSQYVEAYKEYKDLYPEQSARISLRLAEGWQFGDISGGLKALDRLEEFIQTEDAMICYQRANFYYQMDNMYEALSYSKKAVTLEPKVKCFQEDLFYTYLQFEDFENAVGVLDDVRKLGDEIEIDEVFLEVFPEFAASKAYKDWKAEE